MTQRQTRVAIEGDRFHINDQPTYPGREWRGYRIEGLLMNSRMVNGIFDDKNPATRDRWAYPDTGLWNPQRNTNEFIANMHSWRDDGLLAITLNLQGGSPQGYSKEQPWDSSGFTVDGELKPAYVERARRIIERADALGMVVILGLYYFGQDERLRDEAAVTRGVDGVVHWLLDENYTNVVVEINNECNVRRYEHEILQPHRVHELIAQARAITRGGSRLLVGTSYGGGRVPDDNVVEVSDFLLLHGNGVTDPNRIAEMIDQTRAMKSYRPMPIVFNEDDHFDFEQPRNNMVAAVSRYASWGYFDPGQGAGGAAFNGDYVEGYQNVPVNWSTNTDRKRAFFRLLREITRGGE